MAQRCLPLQGPKQELVPDVGLVVKCLCGMTNSQTKVVCSSCYDILPIDSVVVMTGVVLSATSTDVVVIPQVDVVQRLDYGGAEDMVKRVYTQMEKRVNRPQQHWVKKGTLDIQVVQKPVIAPYEYTYVERGLICCSACHKFASDTCFTVSQLKNRTKNTVRCRKCVSDGKLSNVCAINACDSNVTVIADEKLNMANRQESIKTWNELCVAYDKRVKVQVKEKIEEQQVVDNYSHPLEQFVRSALENFEFNPASKTQYDFSDIDVEEVDVIVQGDDEYGLHSPDWTDYGEEERIPAYVVTLPAEVYSALGGKEKMIPVDKGDNKKILGGKVCSLDGGNLMVLERRENFLRKGKKKKRKKQKNKINSVFSSSPPSLNSQTYVIPAKKRNVESGQRNEVCSHVPFSEWLASNDVGEQRYYSKFPRVQVDEIDSSWLDDGEDANYGNVPSAHYG